MKSGRIFINEELELQLRSKGYVKIPFLNPMEISKIRAQFDLKFKSLHQSNKKFHTTYETNNRDLISEVDVFLCNSLEKRAQETFSELDFISANFLVKEPGVGSESPLHQDASFVDEPENLTISVWIPLQDCDDKNGCLQFIPYSHLLFSSVRYIPYSNHHIEKHKQLLQGFLTRHSIKLGEAFVFYNSIVHASSSNKSSVDRLAVVAGLYPKHCKLSLYQKNEMTNTLERFAIEKENLWQINAKFLPSIEQKIEELAIPNNLKYNQVVSFIKSHFSFWERLKSRFN